MFNVTINSISVIYVTVHRCAGACPSTDTGPPFLYGEGDSDTPPHFSRLLRSRWGYGRHILDLTPGPSRGSNIIRDFPNIGYRSVKGHLQSQGFHCAATQNHGINAQSGLERGNVSVSFTSSCAESCLQCTSPSFSVAH